ncbi:hypothetical protein [Acidaminococcus timonensis]|uniref:hypothetical protein n=1 Tax=Acidaminococcus timonensis TaxID=1871002 RepID=UPI003079A586
MEYWENDRSPLLKFYHRHWPAFLLVLLGLLLFFSANGQLLITDPVESNYALTAGEMLVSGGWLSPRIYGNYWYDKPWLFYGELLGNRDSHTLFHMKLCRGLLLSLSIAALWYGPMVQLHGNVFLKGFIGVHNILRATVSEHPRNNTWWYYFLIFLIGCFPWSLSLPWLWKRYGKTLRLRFRRHTFWQSLDDRQRFLFLWVFVTWLFFECMATKYPAYTFPGLPPLAIGLAASLDTLQAEYWAKRLAAGLALVFLVLSHTVAVPLCRQASAWDAAQLIRVYRLPSVPVYVYGGRYPVSFTWYSDIPAPRLVTRERLAEMRPEGISWNAKNCRSRP